MKGDDHGKVRIIVFELEGSNQSIQESLRSVTNVITRGNTLPGSRHIPSKPLPPAGGNGHAGKTPLPPEPTFPFAERIDEEDLDYESEEAPAGAVPKKPKKFVTPKLIESVDFTTGEKPLLDFVGEKRPATDWDRYLVIAAWFKDHRQAETITPDHIYTAYKFLATTDGAWTLPKDVGLPFRDSKKKKSYFANGEKRNMWKITHIGEARVSKLPAE